ncbi:MAG: methylmalonyl-CoA mutase [Candidatus Hydrothermarchaeota archaeon]
MIEKEYLEKIKDEEEKWENTTLKKVLEKFPERKKEFLSESRISIKRVYTPKDIEDTDYINDIGLPGEYPYTRGIQPTMYRGKVWTMRQYSGFGTAEETNERFKYLLEQGQTGLSIAFDLPTQIGLDSDHPLAYGEIGRTGVAIDSLKDMEILFEGIPLDKVSTSMTINAPACVLLAMYIVLAEKQGIPLDKLNGTIQNDILKEYIARNTYIFAPLPSMKLITDIFEFCTKNMPRWNFISVSGYHIREAGATAVQELAFTFANAMTYIDYAIKRGLDVDEFAARISFFFSSSSDLFEEVAKFRAARRIWAKIMRNKFKAKNPRSWLLRFHVQTAGNTLTAQQPENNIVRVTLQALAAVLGGAQSLHTNSMDEAYCLPSEQAVRTALRTQQIIAYESGVTNTVDPLGGSYYIEALTNEIEKQVWEYLEKLEEIGVVNAIESGFIQSEIQSSAYKYTKEIESKERIVVGVNSYQIEEEEKLELLRPNPAVEAMQLERLRKVKEERDGKKVEEALEKLRETAKKEENVMPPIIEAVRSYATIGEICDVLREVYGEYQPITVL